MKPGWDTFFGGFLPLLVIVGVVFFLYGQCNSEPTFWETQPATNNYVADSSAKTSSTTTSSQSASLSTSQASNYVGSQATVCGQVVSTNYATGSNGKPTFLNFDKPYPNHPFAVVIWGNNRSNFPSNPEKYYLNKPLCATGLIESYKGRPEITARTSSQLTIDD